MFRTICRYAIVFSFLAAPTFAQDIPAPNRTAVPTTDAHRDVIREGVAFHDRGEYDNAIRKYQEVLAESPGDTMALYELGFSFFAKGDYTRSLETALAGAQYDSPHLSGFYVLIGNNYDQLRQPEKAVKAYQAGIKRFPDDGQLRYNIAVTYLTLNKSEDAKKNLKESVRLNPNHPSSHLGLGQLFQKEEYRIPALLAFARFLVLEPNSPRSLAALRTLRDLMQSGVRKDDGKNVTILLNPSEKKDEGDFSALSTMLALVGAGRHLQENKGKSEIQLSVEGLDTFLAILSESTGEKKGSGFAWNYYRPYFVEMKRRELVEPFCYLIHRSSNDPEVTAWLSKNAERVNQLIAWSKSYEWESRK